MVGMLYDLQLKTNLALIQNRIQFDYLLLLLLFLLPGLYFRCRLYLISDNQMDLFDYRLYMLRVL